MADELKPVKDFFSKEKDHHAEDITIKGHKVGEEPKRDDEEISLDLSRIKAWIGSLGQKKPSHQTVHKKQEPKVHEDSFDLESTKNSALSVWRFIVKYRAVILLLIPLILSVYIRAIPLSVPITDEWAGSSINQQIRVQMANQVNDQYPNLPDQKKNALVDQQIAKFISENRQLYEDQLITLSDQFKAVFKTEEGVLYLPDIDPYYYARGARNLVEKGHVGDYAKEGIPYNSHQTAPIDQPAERHFHMYFMGYLVKFVRLFVPDASFLAVVAWAPIIMATLGGIPAFFIAQRFGGSFAGFVAAMLLLTNGSWLSRTTAGVADTDAYVLTLPLFVLWSFLIAFDQKNISRKVGYSALTAVLLALFSFAWSGWWYIFDFIIVTLAIDIVYTIAVLRREVSKDPLRVVLGEEIKGALIMLITLIPATVLLTTIIQSFRSYSLQRGFELAIAAFTAPLGIIQLKEAIRANLWPNVLTTVAELNPGDLGAVIGSSGGKFMVFIALVGLSAALLNLKDIKSEDVLFLLASAMWYALLLRYVSSLMTFVYFLAIPIVIKIILLVKEQRMVNIKYGLILTLWMIGTIYAVSKGIRFTLINVPAFALGFANTTGLLMASAQWFYDQLKIPRWVTKPIYATIVILLLMAPTLTAKEIAYRQIPMINDAWWISLETVTENTQPNAIITSWWDFGHWFNFVADRHTTFDGASQDRPQAHWVGRALLSSDEKETVGIIRMLDCSADTGFNRIYNETRERTVLAKTGAKPLGPEQRAGYETFDFLDTIDVVKKVIMLPRNEAIKVYEEKFDGDLAKEFIELTHCDAPEGILITSEDMVGKSGVWGHFGSWNFNRAAMIDFARKNNQSAFEAVALRENSNLTKEQLAERYSEVKRVWETGQANNWIAPWPSFAGGPSGCAVLNATIKCGNGVTVDILTKNVTVQTQDTIGLPRSLIYVEGGKVKENIISEGAEIQVVLIPSGESYVSLLAQNPQGTSVFNRLFFMEGHGLTHFNKLFDATGVTGVRVVTWRIDWEGNSNRTVESWTNKTLPNPSSKRAKQSNSSS